VVPYFRKRLMTCWNDPEWIAQVTASAVRAITLGGDGVFFDNLWMGATPWLIRGRVGGIAGCYCQRCRTAFESETGRPPPRSADADTAPGRTWLEWRASVVERRLIEWSSAVRQLRPDALILANNCDVMLRPTRDLFGLDPVRLARHQDALLVENIAMARIQSRRRLIANALPLKALAAVAPGRPLLSVTYEHGIGLDRPPEAKRLARAIAEAAALQVAPVLKGSEYLDSLGRFTVLTAGAMASARAGAAPLLNWLAEQASLFSGTEPDPDALVFYDADAMERNFEPAATMTYATALALLACGISFAFSTPEGGAGTWDASVPLLLPPGISGPEGATRTVAVTARDLFPVSAPAPLHRFIRRLVDGPLRTISRTYFGAAQFRRLIDSSGITRHFLQSRYFTLPAAPERVAARIPFRRSRPSVASPVLVERRRQTDGTGVVHLVNYADEPASVQLPPDWEVRCMHSPDTRTTLPQDGSSILHLDLYAVVVFTTTHPPPTT
jgi:hypothetical protein